MNKSNLIFKVISLLLSVSILLAVVGCGDNTDSKPSGTSSDASATSDSSDNDLSSDVSSDNVSSEEQSDITQNVSSGEESDDFFDDFEFEDLIFDFSVSQTVTIDGVPEQKNYAGMMGVLPCYWFVPDYTMEDQYTQEEIDISVERFLQMGITTVRCLNFEYGYAWDSKNHCYDWDGEWISGFYEYCDIMKENGIDIILNIDSGVYQKTHSICKLENPVVYFAMQKKPTLFVNYNEKEPTAEQRALINEEMGLWLVEFYNEVVVKRGYTNIKYYEPYTEPNSSTEDETEEYVRNACDKWIDGLVACHNVLTKAGIRDKWKFVGPSTAHASYSDTGWTSLYWLNRCVEKCDFAIDIYASHAYGYNDSMSDDFTDKYDNYADKVFAVIEKTGKPYWCDEFNVMTQIGKFIESSSTAHHGTQIALGYLCHMINNINATCVWYPVDFKWPNENKTSPPSWTEGIHQLGMDTSILESTIPRYAYYAYCLFASAVKPGDNIYSGVATEDGLYTIMLEHTDGTYSFVAINLSWNDNNIEYMLPKSMGGKTFTKAVYDPITITPTTEHKPIEPSSKIENVTNTFSDAVGAYQVVVYNQK